MNCPYPLSLIGNVVRGGGGGRIVYRIFHRKWSGYRIGGTVKLRVSGTENGPISRTPDTWNSSIMRSIFIAFPVLNL